MGIASGDLLMGLLGRGDGRRDFTVTGPTVLRAAAMEKLTKQTHHTKVVVCPATADRLGEGWALLPLAGPDGQPVGYEVGLAGGSVVDSTGACERFPDFACQDAGFAVESSRYFATQNPAPTPTWEVGPNRRTPMTRCATIRGSGLFIPTEEHPNAEFKERFDPEAISKMEEATGIKTRFYAPADWAASDLAVQAGRAALDHAGVGPDEIDLVILGTDTPDYLTPATSVVVQHKMGLRRAGTFDIGCACASFPTGLTVAAGLLATQPNLRNILVIGVYMMHKLADLARDPVSFYYGDGAGAVVVSAADRPGFVAGAYLADGSYANYWGIFAGGTAEPATAEAVAAGRTQVRFLARFPSSVNREGWPRLVREAARNGGFRLEEIDHLIFTQVRSKTIDEVMTDLGLPLDRAPKIMDKWGYLGSACLPAAFHDAAAQGKVKAGDLVVFVGSGVGYNQCAAAFRLPEDFRRPK